MNTSTTGVILAAVTGFGMSVIAQPVTPFGISLLVLATIATYATVATIANAGHITVKPITILTGAQLTIQHNKRRVRVNLAHITAPTDKHPLTEAARKTLEAALQDAPITIQRHPQATGNISRDEAVTLYTNGHDAALILLAQGHASTSKDAPASYHKPHQAAADEALGIHAYEQNTNEAGQGAQLPYPSHA